MSSGYSAKRMRIMQSGEGRGRGWMKRALKQLDEDFGVSVIKCNKKEVGYELESGAVICKKKTFKTLELAEAALNQIHIVHDSRKHKPCRPYRCGYCNGWHLTSWLGINDRTTLESN